MCSKSTYVFTYSLSEIDMLCNFQATIDLLKSCSLIEESFFFLAQRKFLSKRVHIPPVI